MARDCKLEIRKDLHEFRRKLLLVESFRPLLERIEKKVTEDRKYIYSILNYDHLFENPIRDFLMGETLKIPKSPLQAGHLLTLAHQDVRRAEQGYEIARNYASALKLYNSAICTEPQDSPDMALAYWGRMRVLYHLKMYRECLDTMKIAFQKFPQPLADPLVKLGRKCLRRLKCAIPEPNPVEFKEVFGGNHEQLNISRILIVEQSGEMGKSVKTIRNVEPAKLISTEWPFVWHLFPHERMSRCAHCFRQNLVMIPCKDCTCTMYCDRKCLQNGYDDYHKYECNIIDGLHTIFGRFTLGIFAALKYIVTFQTTQNATEFFHDPLNYVVDADEMKDYDVIQDLRLLQELDALEKMRSPETIATVATMTMLAKHLLLNHTELKVKLWTPTDIDFFTKLLYRYFLVCDIYAMDTNQLDVRLKRLDPYGCGLYLFSGQYNHSCAPNAVRVYEAGKCLVFTIRPIKAEEEIFVAYRSHNFWTIPKTERLESLYQQFYFKCRCPACSDTDTDYLAFIRAPSEDSLFEAKTGVDHLFEGFRHFHSERDFDCYGQILRAYEHQYPCKEAIDHSIAFEMDLYCALFNVPLQDRIPERQLDIGNSEQSLEDVKTSPTTEDDPSTKGIPRQSYDSGQVSDVEQMSVGMSSPDNAAAHVPSPTDDIKVKEEVRHDDYVEELLDPPDDNVIVEYMSIPEDPSDATEDVE